MCFTCQNYRRIDKTTLLDTIAKLYHDDVPSFSFYAVICCENRTELNNYVSSLSAPSVVDGWSKLKLVNKVSRHFGPRTLRTQDISALSDWCRSVRTLRHWCRTVRTLPKCLGSEVSWVRSVLTPLINKVSRLFANQVMRP